jgi:integrative and conjugative element protein (TIGR02256 family)
MGTQREDPRGVISFDIGRSGQRLSFDDTVLSHFDGHRQTRFWHREAGGLLFARLALPTIEVCAITGPRRTDRRSRYSYWPDERAEQREIDEMFHRNLHFVGCWHTHPEDVASPSHVDTRNISDCVRRSEHALNGFVMVIVGRRPLPDSLFVSVCDTSRVHALRASVRGDAEPT